MRYLAPLILLLLTTSANAQTSTSPTAPMLTVGEVEQAPVATYGDAFYLTERRTTLYRKPDSTQPTGYLPFRADVTWLGQDGRWAHVRTEKGREGYVDASGVSNVWVRVSKQHKRLYLYHGAELTRTFAADFGYNPAADKQKRGSSIDPDAWRTPEGAFTVVRLHPTSQFYRAFVLNYPTTEDAMRGLAEGLISQSEHDAIALAEANHAEPPMHTALGGLIEIHGRGSGRGDNWTQGCVALTDAAMDYLWTRVRPGTPVLIEP